MRYHQITREERYTLATLRKQEPKLSIREIARLMERHPSTISRELKRNRTPYDGRYRVQRAQEQANSRRSRSRRNSRFTAEDWQVVEQLLRADLSPEQVSGLLRLIDILHISVQTIYSHIWTDKQDGGDLHRHLRQRRRYRKRYGGGAERRGRLESKRHISERPPEINQRTELGHWEGDTMVSTRSKHCLLTLVERLAGCVLIGKLPARTVAAVNRLLTKFIHEKPALFKSITLDNGTEFHGYQEVEKTTGVTFYFATPYHSWERGTNENTNGLIRQYLPKGLDLKTVSQARCTEIALILNNRPRKRFGFLTPIQRLSSLLTEP